MEIISGEWILKIILILAVVGVVVFLAPRWLTFIIVLIALLYILWDLGVF